MTDATQPKKAITRTNDSDSASSDSLISLGKLLHVTGPEFVSALKDAMVEIDASAKHREEIQALAYFLVAFYTTESNQFLSEAQLSQLTFTFRIESVEKTRSCLLAMFRTGASSVVQTRRYRNYFLVPTEAFVSYLCTRTYYRIEGPESGKATAFQFPVRESGIKYFCTAKKQLIIAEEDQSDKKVWTKQDLILANFLHFIVNMFSRTIPGNLLYGIEQASCTGDFFSCIRFLQETLLANPMDLKSVYERIWDQFQRLNREAEHHARVNELKLYCLPIINNDWEMSVLRHKPTHLAAGFINKDAFVKVCSDCIMWTRIDDKSKHTFGYSSHDAKKGLN